MSSILKFVGKSTNTPTNTYEADSIADMQAIDVTNVSMGARCYVIDNGSGVGAWYALSGSKQWHLVPTGGSVTPGEEVIYDGGSIDAQEADMAVIIEAEIRFKRGHAAN